MEMVLHNGFYEVEQTEMEAINGGYTLQEYELAVLGVTTTFGIIVSAACPAVGAGLIVLGWAMCAQAEEAGRNK